MESVISGGLLIESSDQKLDSEQHFELKNVIINIPETYHIISEGVIGKFDITNPRHIKALIELGILE
jgi:hypothetical protein